MINTLHRYINLDQSIVRSCCLVCSGFWVVAVLSENKLQTAVQLASLYKGLDSLGRAVSYGVAMITRKSASHREFLLLIVITFLLSVPVTCYAFLKELPEFLTKEESRSSDGQNRNPVAFDHPLQSPSSKSDQSEDRASQTQSSRSIPPSLTGPVGSDIGEWAEDSGGSVVCRNELENFKAIGFRHMHTMSSSSHRTTGRSYWVNPK